MNIKVQAVFKDKILTKLTATFNFRIDLNYEGIIIKVDMNGSFNLTNKGKLPEFPDFSDYIIEEA